MSTLFDRASLMERIGNDEHVLRELVDPVMDLQPQRMNELAHALASEELDLARGYAHTLAGGFRSVSMPSLGDLAKEIELCAAREELAECRNRFLELDATFAQVMAELEALQTAWRGGLTPSTGVKVAA